MATSFKYFVGYDQTEHKGILIEVGDTTTILTFIHAKSLEATCERVRTLLNPKITMVTIPSDVRRVWLDGLERVTKEIEQNRRRASHARKKRKAPPR